MPPCGERQLSQCTWWLGDGDGDGLDLRTSDQRFNSVVGSLLTIIHVVTAWMLFILVTVCRGVYHRGI